MAETILSNDIRTDFIKSVEPIETKFTIKEIINFYKTGVITPAEYVSRLKSFKYTNEDIVIFLNLVNNKPSNSSRVLFIINKFNSIGKRLTINTLRQQTAWLKADCESILNSMVADGTIKRVVENVSGKDIIYYL